jgi:hypothetical protein
VGDWDKVVQLMGWGGPQKQVADKPADGLRGLTGGGQPMQMAQQPMPAQDMLGAVMGLMPRDPLTQVNPREPVPMLGIRG